MENTENMAQQSISEEKPKFIPAQNKREIKSKKEHEIEDIEIQKISTEIKEKLKNSKFNNPHNWPVYTKYLPKDDPRYTGL